MAWATCQGVDDLERVEPAIFREILARIPGSHDHDCAVGGKYHKYCDTVPSPLHSLPYEYFVGHQPHDAILRHTIAKDNGYSRLAPTACVRVAFVTYKHAVTRRMCLS